MDTSRGLPFANTAAADEQLNVAIDNDEQQNVSTVSALGASQ
jgi:hypothetical protein